MFSTSFFYLLIVKIGENWVRRKNKSNTGEKKIIVESLTGEKKVGVHWWEMHSV